MFRSWKVSLAFVTVFLIGAAVGSLISVNVYDERLSRFMERSGDPASLSARINQRLTHDFQLTADEQKRIQPITREMTQHFYELRRQYGTNVISTFDEYHQRIADQLTPEQRVAYLKDNDQRRQRVSGMLLPEGTAPDETPAKP